MMSLLVTAVVGLIVGAIAKLIMPGKDPGGILVTMLLGIAMFAPWGIAAGGDWAAVPIALGALVAKLALAGFGLALLETMSAKMRIFRAPEFLATAFLFATLGMLTHFVLEA